MSRGFTRRIGWIGADRVRAEYDFELLFRLPRFAISYLPLNRFDPLCISFVVIRKSFCRLRLQPEHDLLERVDLLEAGSTFLNPFLKVGSPEPV